LKAPSKALAAMRSAVVLALLGLLLVTLQLASASRPLFGIGRGTQKVDGAEVKRLRRYVSTLPSKDLREMLTAPADSQAFDRHYMELGHYEVTPEDRARMQTEVKQYWQHFRANQVEEEYDLDDYLDGDFEPRWQDEDEWFEKYSDWYEEDEDVDEEYAEAADEDDMDYAEEEPQRKENALDLNDNDEEYDYDEDEEEKDNGKEDEAEDEGKGALDGEDWVLELASAMRTGDKGELEQSVRAAISSGDRNALKDLVEEAADMANGSLLQEVWTRVTGDELDVADDGDEEKYADAWKMEEEAGALEEEANDIIGEAEDLKMEADALEKEAESIDASANEYERIEATDELGEAAEALDTEATKLELESAKLRAEATRLEAESNRLKAAAASGKDDEAEWLEDEAERLTEEAGKLQQEAEDLKSKADQLDVEADRIDRIEDDRYAADAADRQSRIDKDLDNDGVAYDYEDEAEEEPAARSKGPLSHSSLVSRFKTLLKVAN